MQKELIGGRKYRMISWEEHVSRRRRIKRWLRLLMPMIIAVLLCVSIFYTVKYYVWNRDTLKVVDTKEVKIENFAIQEKRLVAVADVVIEEIHKESPLIVIDPGHGGIDEGASKDDVLEKDINLQIAMFVRNQLVDLGYEVLMIREEDVYMDVEQRVEIANESKADIYVSIHQNAHETSKADGMETWYDGSNTIKDSKRLATLIHRGTIQSTGAKEREINDEADFYVTTNTQMPACLIETGFLTSNKERALLKTTEYQEKIAEGIVKGIDLYFNPKTMYLTFDDGPSSKHTESILDTLKEKNVKATFFVIGENVLKYPELAKRIVAEGHEIGIHCNRHDYKEIYESVESYVQDFEEAYNIVREVTGVEATLFRFPGGSVNPYNVDTRADIIEEMTNRGFVYFDWNATIEDSVSNAGPEKLIQNGRNTIWGRSDVFLLAHDVYLNTALCLEGLIDEFPDYQMEVLTPDVVPMQF